MLSLLLLLPPVLLAQGEGPVACLQSGACFQVTFWSIDIFNLAEQILGHFLATHRLCRAPMATHRLDGSTLPTRQFGMQSRLQEAGGTNQPDITYIHVSIQVCGS